MARQTDVDIDHIDPRWEEGRDYQLVCGFEKDPKNLREEDWKKNTAKSNRFLPWRWCRDEIGVVPEEPGDLALFLVGADIEKDIPGEWVLMEFLSEEWFEASKRTCSRSHRKVPVNVEALVEGQRKFRENNPERYKEVIDGFILVGRKWIEENKELHLQLVKEGREKLYEQNPGLKEKHVEALQEGFKEWYDNLSEEDLEERREIISEKTREAMASLPPEKREKLIKGCKEGAKKQHAQRWMCKVTGYITTPAPLSSYQKARGIDHKDPNNRIRIN
jgi:hypothetical protein